jgi:uncharacterized protein DUF7033
MTLLITHPANYQPEREYTLRVLLTDFLGVHWHAEATDSTSTIISVAGATDGKSLRIADHLFQCSSADWLQPASLPRRPLPIFGLEDLQLTLPDRSKHMPVLYGSPACSTTTNAIDIGLDIFGAAFFLLTRYEEAIKPDRDAHDRFPAVASVTYQERVLHRPLVDEYVELLWHCMHRLWPRLERKQSTFRTVVTCDVDSPLTCWARRPGLTLRKCAGDLLRRRSVEQARASLRLFRDHRAQRYERDPLFTFNSMHEACEAAGLRSTFYFIADHTAAEYDGCYSLEEDVIRQLVRSLHERGHEIGLHGSYHSFRDPAQLQREAQRLSRLLVAANAPQAGFGGRQHYLRWAPETAAYLQLAGLQHDSTLGFADAPGFRCGTCHQYPLYDLVQRRALSLVERPLIAMEQSVFSPKYAGLGHTAAALDAMLALKRTCRAYGGEFVFLWHNSSLTTPLDREFYRTLLAA